MCVRLIREILQTSAFRTVYTYLYVFDGKNVKNKFNKSWHKLKMSLKICVYICFKNDKNLNNLYCLIQKVIVLYMPTTNFITWFFLFVINTFLLKVKSFWQEFKSKKSWGLSKCILVDATLLYKRRKLCLCWTFCTFPNSWCEFCNL